MPGHFYENNIVVDMLDTDSYAYNAKKFVETLVANEPELSISRVVSDTSDSYEAYLSWSQMQNASLRFWCSSSFFYISCYYYDTVIVCRSGSSRTESARWSIPGNATQNPIHYFKMARVKKGDGWLSIACGSASETNDNCIVTILRVVDYYKHNEGCGAVYNYYVYPIFVLGTYYGMRNEYDGNYDCSKRGAQLLRVYNPQIVHASPCNFYGLDVSGFVGGIIDNIYYIGRGDSSIDTEGFPDITIDGKQFKGIGGGYAVRIG